MAENAFVELTTGTTGGGWGAGGVGGVWRIFISRQISAHVTETQSRIHTFYGSKRIER